MRLAALTALALLAAPASASATPYPDAVGATAGLVGYWRLGEESGTTAQAAAGAAAGAWTGAVQLGTPGALAGDGDTAATLNGAVRLSLGSAWNAAGDLTLEAWVAPSAVSGTRYVLSKGSTTTGFQLYLTSSRQPAFSVGTTSGTYTATAPSGLAAGTWHHVAATLRASTLTVYVDGSPVATRVASGTVRRSNGLALMAGRYSATSTGPYAGALDDLAVYDGALSDAAVAAHAAAGIDPSAPGVSVSGPASRTDLTSAAFTLASLKPRVTYACSLDGGAYSACDASPAYANLPYGDHVLRVSAVDRWGQTVAPAATYAWTVDLRAAADYVSAAPTTTITPRVAALTPSTDAAFTLSASKDRTTFACSLDGAAFAACGTEVKYSYLAAGDHTLRVRATDRFGQTEASPATFGWKIDRTAPETYALAVAPAPGQSEGSAVFAGTEPGRFECKVGGGGDWTPCSSPVALPEGVASVTVRALDGAGNADASPATVVLGAAPEGEPTGAAAFTSAAAGLAFTATRGGALTCRLDDGAWSECGSPLSLDGLPWGRHTFAVRASFSNGIVLESPAAAWTAAVPAARIAALQFPVLLKRGRDGRARANGRKPALRFALNVSANVKLRVTPVKRGRVARALGSWTVKVVPGDAVVPVPDSVVRRLRRGRYKLVAQVPGAKDVARSFAVV